MPDPHAPERFCFHRAVCPCECRFCLLVLCCGINIHIPEMIDQVAHLVVLHIRFRDELGLRIIQRDTCVIFLGQDLICLFVHICTSSLVGRLSCLS